MIIPLRESLKAFTAAVPQSTREKLRKQFDPIASTQKGQMTILKQASMGEGDAALYLYDRLEKIVAKAFWKYYLGPNKEFRKVRMVGGAAQEFIAVTFELLMDRTRDPSPYKTFDPSKFNASADLIKQFGYYLYRYLQNEAFKLIRSARSGGVTGSAEGGVAISTQDYDTAVGDDVAVESHSDAIDQQETIRAFYDHLKATAPAIAPMFADVAKGATTAELSKKHKITGTGVRHRMGLIKQAWEEFNK